MPYKDPAKHREVTRAHYRNNKEYYAKRNLKKKEEYRDIVRSAKDRPCTDCNESYPYYVMQFDHLPEHEKLFNIGSNLSVGKNKLLAEIAKCEVVCANCHAVRTYSRSVIDSTADSESASLGLNPGESAK